VPRPFLIRTASQLRAFNAPARLGIIEALLEHTPLTASEIASRTGAAPAAVHYHLKALTKLGMVRQKGARATGRRPATLFDLAHRDIRLEPRTRDAAFRREQARGTRLMLSRAARELAAALAPDPAPANPFRPRLTRDILHLTDTKLRELDRRLKSLDRFLRTAGAPGAPHRVAVTLAAVPIAPPRQQKRP
jgi:DNA-binding transcriptional ArsR family regulator